MYQILYRQSILLLKQLAALFLLVSLLSCRIQKIDSVAINESISVAETRSIISTLASDEMQGREPGTPGIEKAALFIENYLKTANIKPFFNDSYRDKFLINNTEAYNIVGVISGKKSKDEYIIVSAHYDHIGTAKPKTPGADSIYNGANDNASGVTGVLQIARFLAKHHFDKKILVVLFSGEEKGLLGSKHLASKLQENGTKVKYVVNLEMIGKTLSNAPGQVYMTGFKLSDFAPKINKALGSEFITYLEAETAYKLFYRSDNYPFYEHYQIPSHTLSTFDFKNSPYYHHLKDEVAELDIENMNAVIRTTTQVIITLLNQDPQIKIQQASVTK